MPPHILRICRTKTVESFKGNHSTFNLKSKTNGLRTEQHYCFISISLSTISYNYSKARSHFLYCKDDKVKAGHVKLLPCRPFSQCHNISKFLLAHTVDITNSLETN